MRLFARSWLFVAQIWISSRTAATVVFKRTCCRRICSGKSTTADRPRRPPPQPATRLRLGPRSRPYRANLALCTSRRLCTRHDSRLRTLDGCAGGRDDAPICRVATRRARCSFALRADSYADDAAAAAGVVGNNARLMACSRRLPAVAAFFAR